ncbi:hypothetical protein BDV96DRAFT_202893 [Lophiotrema nucula]|uniref:Short-chain dehydrogenases/reductase n=1 Tax=Lophiotrema nucula TaxID=690887 RepID=A0A6A5YU74_9PLEO|nr:hypothetical protein BDV96DRAFT_202893 [Lophiotrema nucula]
MVSQEFIRASNAKLPSNLIGVFVGATSGIGEYTLKSFAQNCQSPKAYFVGRSQAAADRITKELRTLNPNGTYHFIKSDISLVKSVDSVCQQIKEKETYINILVMSQGTMSQGMDTEEGLHLPATLLLHSRARFIANLLPELQRATVLRRVLSIFTGTKEGPMPITDFQMRNLGMNLIKMRGQAASMLTLYQEHFATLAPSVSFVHDFPGPVKSNIARGGGIINLLMRTSAKIIGPFVFIPEGDSGDRHLYLATSSRYSAREGGVNGVEVEKGVEVARGTDGKVGSGCYTVDEKCESGNAEIVSVLKGLREQGKGEEVWKHLVDEWVRITGKESI